jgi:hypothetical protein
LFTNKPDRTLRVDDIEGARARRAEFHTERVVNPLEPKYKLPSCEVLPPPVPNFIRDNINVDDIKGTKPPPLYPWRQRDTHSVDDIEGAKAGWKPRHKLVRKQGEPRDYMDTSDISGPKKKFQRDVSSLEPRYEIHGLVIEDDPVKSKPKALPKGKTTILVVVFCVQLSHDCFSLLLGACAFHNKQARIVRISLCTLQILKEHSQGGSRSTRLCRRQHALRTRRRTFQGLRPTR